MQSLSIIVPCFNETKNIPHFYNVAIGEKWRKSTAKNVKMIVAKRKNRNYIVEYSD